MLLQVRVTRIFNLQKSFTIFYYQNAEPIENLEKAKSDKKLAEASQLEIELGGLRATHQINLRTKDSKIDLSVKQHLKEQQNQLAREDIPGFVVTDDSRKIRLQYYLVNSLISMAK